LIHRREIADAHCRRHESRRLLVLRLIRIKVRHRDRDAVGREYEARARAKFHREASDGLAYVIGVGRDEALIQVPVVHVGNLDVRQPALGERGPRGHHVLAILKTA
jgi:hypothetical protein